MELTPTERPHGVFIHVPKTAGTTVAKVFGSNIFLHAHRDYADTRISFLDDSGFSTSHWESLFRFSFVRNPWDRYFSWFFWRFGHQNEPRADPEAFRGFIRTRFVDHRNMNPDVMFDGAHLNFVGRYENLREGLVRCGRSMGITVEGSLPHEHKGTARPSKDWRAYYDQESRDLVAQMGAWEIERFGYTFEGE